MAHSLSEKIKGASQLHGRRSPMIFLAPASQISTLAAAFSSNKKKGRKEGGGGGGGAHRPEPPYPPLPSLPRH